MPCKSKGKKTTRKKCGSAKKTTKKKTAKKKKQTIDLSQQFRSITIKARKHDETPSHFP